MLRVTCPCARHALCQLHRNELKRSKSPELAEIPRSSDASFGVGAFVIHRFYGGKPIDSFTTRYSAWTSPVRVRMVKAGSIHMCARKSFGRSFERTIAKSDSKGG